jgi:hypothetical protein
VRLGGRLGRFQLIAERVHFEREASEFVATLELEPAREVPRPDGFGRSHELSNGPEQRVVSDAGRDRSDQDDCSDRDDPRRVVRREKESYAGTGRSQCDDEERKLRLEVDAAGQR